MKLVRWSFQGLHMPMMEDDSGELYCTSKAICEALAIDEATLRKICERHPEEVGENCVTDCHAKLFLKENKAEFGVRYVRGDMRLWTEDDMLTFAFHARSNVALEFRRKLRQFIKQNARRGYVKQVEFDRLQGRLDQMAELIQSLIPSVDKSASLAGSLLAEQKHSKAARLAVAQ